MNESVITRVAMWSGPRNISTAMMRSWENRSDTFVSDEPFYAHYLSDTDMDHPGKDKVIASQPTDWQQVASDCVSLSKTGCTVHYQKHMTQHMLAHIDLGWLKKVQNIFLIRSPEEVVASYTKTRPELTPEDLGFKQQHRLFEHVRNHLDPEPLVVAAADVLADPAGALTAVCEKCALEFDHSMLQWPAGKRDTDGVWAPYWYSNVEKSTGFLPSAGKQTAKLDSVQRAIADQCAPYYETLQQHAIQI